MKKQILSMLLAIVMVVGLMPGFAITASAAEITVGDFTVAPTDGTSKLTAGADYSYADGKLTVTTTTHVTIGMKNGVTVTTDTIVVDSIKGEASVTFDSIGIDTAEDAAITVKGANKVTFAFIGESLLSPADDGDGINVAADTPIVLTSTASGKLSISGVKFGIFLDGYSTGGSVAVSGNLKLDITDCVAHAIYCRNTGSATISGTPVINIDTAEYAIYAHGIDISGGTITVKNDEGYSITGADGADITLSNSADLHIIEGKGGLRTNGGKITITDSAKLKVYDVDDWGNKVAVVDSYPLISTGSSGEIEISKNAVVELYSANDAISGGKTSILDNAQVDIVIDTDSTYSEYALSFDDTLTITGNASVDIDVVKGAKIHGLYDSSGTVNVSGNAVVTIDGTTYKGVYVNALNLSGKSSVTVNHKGTSSTYYAIDGGISVTDTAALTATSGDYRVVGDPCTVTPAEGKAYMVKVGVSEAEATTTYYTTESTVKDKSTWRYLHIESVSVVAVTYTDGIEGTELFADQENTVSIGSTTPAFDGTPMREGYTFTGWYPEVSDIVEGPATYTAQWDVNQYTITFDTAGGGEIAAITQDYGTSVTAPAEPEKGGYTFGGWSPAIPTTMPANDVTVTAQWLSADTGITSVKVFDTDVITLGETMTVTLPYGSALPTAGDIAVTRAADTSISEITTTDGGTTWTFTVSAQDGQTAKIYTLTISIAENPAAANMAALEEYKETLEASVWAIPQNTANTEDAVKAWLESELDELLSDDVKYSVDVNDFVAATSGNADSPSGTNGSYSAVITLEKGDNTGNTATSTYAAETITITSGTITAAPYLHTHDYDWLYDADGHWEVCACGDDTDKAAHSFDRTNICTVCGYAKPDDNFDDMFWLTLLMLYNQEFDITASTTEGGTITPAGVSKVKYSKDITYTITPADGYAIADVIVDGKSVGAVSVYTFDNVRKDHEIAAIFAEIPWENPYSDVSENDWFYEDVKFVDENNLMIGTVENEIFAPYLTTTRAMIVTILWRLEGEPVVNYLMQFEDVPQDEWYSEAVRWAAANGIVLGYDDGLFYPEKAITREQLAAILHRYAAYKGVDNGAIFPMIPQSDYSEWAENDVIWADMNGLLDGIGKDMTDMTADASRSEVAAILRRFCERFAAE